jgi:hypothetical protein
MKTASENRLQKLETLHGKRDARMFVIEGSTPAERDAYVKGLVESGKARQSDTFIHTGVPRSEPRYTDCGTIPELMARVAAHGSKVHDPSN